MKFAKVFVPLFLLAGAAAATAQNGYSQVSASAGSVAAWGGSGAWAGLKGSASRATIALAYNNSNVTSPNAFKFATGPSGIVSGKALSGYSASSAAGFVAITGASKVDTSVSGPDYFTLDWTSELYSQGGPANSGTFDPFDVRYGDVSGIAGSGGGLVDLYFQSSLRKSGAGGTTFLVAGSGVIADYGYSLYITDASNVRTDILSLNFSTAGGLAVDFNAASGIDLFLLGANAEDPSATPGDRIAAGTAISTQSGASALLSPFFRTDGRLLQDLNFGLRRQVSVQPGGNPNDPLFSWHVDTKNDINPVPEPASMAALGLGALGLLRRRKAA